MSKRKARRARIEASGDGIDCHMKMDGGARFSRVRVYLDVRRDLFFFFIAVISPLREIQHGIPSISAAMFPCRLSSEKLNRQYGVGNSKWLMRMRHTLKLQNMALCANNFKDKQISRS